MRSSVPFVPGQMPSMSAVTHRASGGGSGRGRSLSPFSLASRLTRRVGRALGAWGTASQMVDRLEERTLLEGSFDAPLVLVPGPEGRFTGVQTISSPGDQDIFEFVAPANAFVSVLADTSNEANRNADTRVEIFAASNTSTPIAVGADNGTVTSGFQKDGWAGFLATQAQRYFIRVSSEGGTQGAYTLRVRGTNAEFEIGGELNGTTEINLGVSRKDNSPPPNFGQGLPPPDPPLLPVTGQLGGTGPINSRIRQDEIVYRWTVPQTQLWNNLATINAISTQEQNLSARLDTHLDIYNAQGQLIVSDQLSGRINDAFATLRVQPGATYFIRVRSDEVSTPTIQLATGPFYLVIDAIPDEVPMSRVLRRGALEGLGLLGYNVDDTDPPNPAMPPARFFTGLHSFTAQGNGLAFITVRATGLSPMVNPAVGLYNDRGERVGFNDNFIGFESQLEVNLVGGERYFVVVDGFERFAGTTPNGSQYSLYIEANHTFDRTPGNELDDHPDTPNEKSTALPWSDPFLTRDADGNPIRDRGMRVTSTASGRLHETAIDRANGDADVDFFQFTAPSDMLRNFGGNDDNQGTALYFGGSFDAADVNSAFPTFSRALGTWDAGDYWYVGPQNTIPVQPPIVLGLSDNPDTPATTRPEIYALYNWTPSVNEQDARPILVVGGDFRLRFRNPNNPGQIITVNNLAAWAFNPATGRYSWSTFSRLSADAPVRSIIAYNPPDFDPDGSDGPVESEDPGDQRLVIGGDFNNFELPDGTQFPAQFLAAVTYALPTAPVPDLPIAGVEDLGGPGGINAPVLTMELYNPPDAGAGRPGQPGPPPVPAVADPADIPLAVFFGGNFTNRVRYYNGRAATDPAAPGINLVPGLTINNGTVFSLKAHGIADIDGTPFDPNPLAQEDAVQVLMIGGQYGGTASNGPSTNMSLWGVRDTTQDPQAPGYNPRLLSFAVGGFETGAVRAMESWDLPDINNQTVPSILAVGGAFEGFLAGWDTGPGGTGPFPMDQNYLPNGPVFALRAVQDRQEPSIENNLDSGSPQRVLYAGGAFDTLDPQFPGLPPITVNGIYQLQAATGRLGQDDFLFLSGPLADGVGTIDNDDRFVASGQIFALSDFDDGVEEQFDRHERPATRLSIAVSGDAGGFVNMQIRVVDSRGNIVYSFERPGSDTIAPGLPDPAGMVDPSLSIPDRDTELDGIIVWGGETYFLEVSGNPSQGLNTGRYSVSITADAGVRNVRQRRDGSLEATTGPLVDINQQPGFPNTDEAQEGQFTNAIQLTPALLTGDTNSFFGVQGGAVVERRFMRVPPTLANPFLFFENPRFIMNGDQGVIQTITDADVYFFRAEFTGTAEVRLSTLDINDEYAEGIQFETRQSNFQQTTTQLTTVRNKTYDSALDASMRVFDNDFTQIAFNDDNPAWLADAGDRLAGNPPTDRDTTGSFQLNVPDWLVANDPGRYRKSDPRVVFPVVAGEVYYFQVESGQRFKIANPPEFYDNIPDPTDPRTSNIDREIDWRRATGSYRFVVNAMPQLPNDIENGQVVQDDHASRNVGGLTFFDLPFLSATDPQTAIALFNANTQIATVIPMGDPQDQRAAQVVTPTARQTRGTISGVINNTPAQANDVDIFRVVAPGTGPLTIRLRRADGSGVEAQMRVFRTALQSAGEVSGAANGELTLVTDANAGETFLIGVQALSVEGGYTIEVLSASFADDHADFQRWWNATTLELQDFRGVGEIEGSIEAPADTDAFRFEFPRFSFIDVSVTSLSGLTFRPRVTVYEVSENSLGEAVFLRIAGVTTTTGLNPPSPVTVRASVAPDRIVDVPDPGEDRVYPFYYVVVEGFNQAIDVGNYRLTLNFAGTDDHPDATDLDNNNIYDTSEFASATGVLVDNTTGLGTGTGVLEVASDTDLFSFTAPATGPVNVSLTRATGSLLRGRVSILDATGNLLARATADDVFVGTTITATLANLARGARVWVVVESVTPNLNTEPFGGYTLNVQAAPVDDYPNATEWPLAQQLNFNTATGAATLPNSGTPTPPQISPLGDSDLFFFRPLAAGQHVVSIAPLASPSGATPLRVEVYRAIFTSGTESGQTLVGTDVGDINDPATVVLAGVALGEKYYVLVRVETGAGSTDTGGYTLSVAGPVPTNPPPDPDPGAIDFNFPTAIVLNSRDGNGSTLTRIGANPQRPEILPAGDRDLYSFTTASAGRVFVRLTLPQGSLLDGRMEVYRRATNGSPILLGTNDDGAPGVTSAFDFIASANETYFVIVDGIGDTTGSYVLTVDTQAAVNRLFYPEGYATNLISEFVPIVNPNPFPVNYTVRLRYESGQFESVFPLRTIGANTRDGVTINAPINGVLVQDGPVLQNVPYSVIIEWTVPTSFVNAQGQTVPVDPATIQPLGATMSHYDQLFGTGTSTGDAFTERVSSTWNFPRLEVRPGVANNYVVVYNPQDFDVQMQLVLYAQDGRVITLPGGTEGEWRTIPGGRRSGFGLNDFVGATGTGFFAGTLRVRPVPGATEQQLAAFEGVVAALSAYTFGGGDEWAIGTLGDPDGGSRANAITNLTQGNGVSSEVTIFNPGDTPATVTLNSRFIRTGIQGFSRVVNVPAQRSVTIAGSTLGIVPGQPVGITLDSNVNVSVLNLQLQRGDADAPSPSTVAGNRFLFGDAFIDARSAGRLYFETLFFYNPSAVNTTVNIALRFFNQPSQPTAFTQVFVGANGFAELRLHELPAILNIGGPAFYSIDVSSAVPIMTTLEHYDLFLGGGWSARGVPFGPQTPLTNIRGV